MKKHILLILVSIILSVYFSPIDSYAQTARAISKMKLKKKKRIYKSKPVWIEFMSDTGSNYHEAILAFEEFWKGKPEPEEVMEGEYQEEQEKKSFLKRLFTNEEKERNEILKYAVTYKKFCFWRVKNAGYLRDDGSVMSEQEKQNLIEQEIKNRLSN